MWQGRGLSRGGEGEGPGHQDSNNLPSGVLVCPGCTSSGLRGGVRNRSICDDAQTAESNTEQRVERRAVPTPTAASTEFSALGRTFHTSLGVVVDICTWWRQSKASLSGVVHGDRAAGSSEFRAESETGTTSIH